MKRSLLFSAWAIVLLGIHGALLSKVVGAGSLTIHNGTDENLCFAYVKTKASLKGLIGLDKDKHQIMYDEEVQGQEEILPIGTSAKLNAYDSDREYDRVLWVVSAKECDALNDLGGGNKPHKAIALEVGSKNDVVIVSDGPGKFKLKGWTQSLGEDLDRRKRAMYESLLASGLTWEDLKDNSKVQWVKASEKFKDAYAKLKRAEKSASSWKAEMWVSEAKRLFTSFNERLDKIDLSNKLSVNVLAKKIELAASNVFRKFKEKASKINPPAAADIELPSFVRNLKIEDVTRAYEQLNDILKFDDNAKQHMQLLTTAYETVKKVYDILNNK